MPKLRLCYISNPNSIHTRRWVSWFAAQGHTICVLADVPFTRPWPEMQVIDLSQFFHAPVIRFAVWAIWLRRFVHQWRPDVLHAHRVNSAGWLAAASGFHPYVVTPWGSDVFVGPQRSRLAHSLASFTLAHADRVTSISKAMSERLIELGALEERLSRIYFGIDLTVFNPGAPDSTPAEELRRNLSLAAEAAVIFSPRAVHPIYNQDVILQAVPQVRKHFPKACFIFIDYNTDAAYKEKLDHLASSLGIREAIRWLPPTSSPAEMAQWYRLSDVVVSVPSSDGTPLTVLEAMACARPVICSDLPALREFITNDENGWLVPVRQAVPLAEAIVRLLEQPEHSAELGRKAHQLVAQCADIEQEMQHMQAIYYQLATEK
jgi:glycosyltransferase involved in cell wall biosynthesis